MLCTHSFSERQRGERQIYRDRAWSIPTWKYSFITDLCLDHAISLVSQLRHNVKQVQLQPIITAGVIYLFTSTICTCWCEMISNCTLTLSVSQVKMFNNKTKQDLFLLQLQDCLSPQKHTVIGTQAVKLKMKMWEESAKNFHIRDVFVWLHKDWLFLVFCIWVFHLNWADPAGEYSAA